MNEEEAHYSGAEYEKLMFDESQGRALGRYYNHMINLKQTRGPKFRGFNQPTEHPLQRFFDHKDPETGKKDLQSIIPCIVTIKSHYDVSEALDNILEFLPERYEGLAEILDIYKDDGPFDLDWEDSVKHLHIRADEMYLTDGNNLSIKTRNGVRYKRVKYGTLLSEYQRVSSKTILNLDVMKITPLNLLDV